MAALIEIAGKENIILNKGQFVELGSNGQSVFVIATNGGGTWVGHKMQGEGLKSEGKVKVKPEGCGIYSPKAVVELMSSEGPIKITNQVI